MSISYAVFCLKKKNETTRAYLSPLVIPSDFFFHDTAPTQIYTLSLHDALPIYRRHCGQRHDELVADQAAARRRRGEVTRLGSSTRRITAPPRPTRRLICDQLRSEEHTSELQSHVNLVCRLLLEKKK